ncbi:hypothetical protein ACXZ1K_11500 [Pedobacter sp. PWIIR3]
MKSEKIFQNVICLLTFVVTLGLVNLAVAQSSIRLAAANKAIHEFVSNSKISSKAKVFWVAVNDNLARYELQKEPDSNGVHFSIPVETFDGIFVSIKVECYQYPVSKLGLANNPILPTRALQVGEKLFIWRDKDNALTEETLTILRKYNLLFDDEGGVRNVMEKVFPTKYKPTYYYFCRTDLTKFKTILTWNSSEYVSFPKLKCP